MKDGKIVRAELNEPLDFICRQRLQKHPVFDLVLVGGPDGSRTHDPFYAIEVLCH